MLQGLMPTPPADSIANSIGERAFSARASAALPAKPSEIERLVMGLFEEFRNSLLRYSLSFGLSVHDGEEVTQDVFLALFRHLQMRRSRKNLRGWIFRVAHNMALKRRYANQRFCDPEISGLTMAEQKPDPSLNPEDEACFRQRRCHLLAVVEVLPEQDRYCLRLRAEGLRYREIASVLGISLGAVSLSLTRSLARLMRADGGRRLNR